MTGENFKTDANPDVKIAGVQCVIQTANPTQITCLTGTSPKTAIGVDIDLSFVGMGRAVPSEKKFDYIDLWSSKWSWGNKEPPQKGTFNIYFTIISVLMREKTYNLRI